jgi:hypothetical protein
VNSAIHFQCKAEIFFKKLQDTSNRNMKWLQKHKGVEAYF